MDLYKIASKTEILDSKQKSPLLDLLLNNEIGKNLVHSKESGISLYYPIYGALYADTSIKSMQVQNLVIILKLTDAELFKKFVEKTHTTLLNSNQQATIKNQIYRYNTAKYSIVWNNEVATINVFNARNAYTFVIREDMWLGINILKNSEKQTNHNIIDFNNQNQDIGVYVNNESLLNLTNSLQSQIDKKNSDLFKISSGISIQFNTGRIQLSSKNYLTAKQQQTLNIWKQPSTTYLNTLPSNPIALSSMSIDLEKLKNLISILTSKNQHPIQLKEEFDGLSGDIGIALNKIKNVSLNTEIDGDLESYNEEFQPSPRSNLTYDFQIILGKSTPAAEPKYSLSILEVFFKKIQQSKTKTLYLPRFGGSTVYYLHTLNDAWVFTNLANITEPQQNSTYPALPIFGSINLQHPDVKLLKESLLEQLIYRPELTNSTNWIKHIQWRGDQMQLQMDVEMMDSSKNALNYLLDNGYKIYQINNNFN